VRLRKSINTLSRLRPLIRQTLTAFSYLPRALALVWHAAKGWTVAWLILLTVQGALPVATVYLTRDLVNRLVNAPLADLPATLTLVVLLAVLLLLSQTLGGLTDWVRAAQSEWVKDHLTDLIHAQAAALDLSFYDSPAYADMLHRARVDAINRPVALIENLGALLQNSLTLIAMAGVLLPFGLWMPLALIVSTIPALVVAFYFTVRQHQFRVRTTSEQRRILYYDWLLTARDAATELRLFNLHHHFRAGYQTLRRKLRTEQLHLLRHQAFAELLAGGFALSITGAVMAWMTLQTLQARLPLGDLALLYQAFILGQNLTRTLLENASKIYSNSLFLQNLFEFLSLQPLIAEPAAPAPLTLQRELRFENVRFHYPDSERDALDHFDLTLRAGQITAIVGTNGAGKSTVVKLLCRFYDPTEGRILLDGVDLRQLPVESWQKAITVLFQEHVRYQETASLNIAFGDLRVAADPEKIRHAAHAAGADSVIERLPKGYDHVLGKWFGGAELSVGEWQRLALARAFLRQAPFIALDEPTSAMDSWAETDWMSRFRALVAGRAALIITHRFTTAMQADVIHVMDEGRIIESGSHAQLLTLGGRYAQSWHEQMKQRT